MLTASQVEHYRTFGYVVLRGALPAPAVEALSAAGAKVVGIVALVDRLEGGREAIEAAGLPLESLFTRNDFMS